MVHKNYKTVVTITDGEPFELSIEQRIKRLEKIVAKLIVEKHYKELVKDGVIK